MKENFLIAKKKDMEQPFTKMEVNIRDFGRIINTMVKEYLLKQMENI